MNKITFHWINEWKEIPSNIRVFTPIHFHIARCVCGCHEFTVFFILFSLGFFITINPTPVEKIK